MPRDAIAVTALASGEGVENPAGTTITPANGATIANAGETNRLILEIENTFAGAKEVTIKAGDTNPPAVRRGIGDLKISIAENKRVKVILESARFKNKDGSISIDWAAAMTGKAWAFRVPKAV